MLALAVRRLEHRPARPDTADTASYLDELLVAGPTVSPGYTEATEAYEVERSLLNDEALNHLSMYFANAYCK